MSLLVKMLRLCEFTGGVLFMAGSFEKARRLFEVTTRAVDGNGGQGTERD